jgi:hypothetical protein
MTFFISLSVMLALWFTAPDTHQKSTSEQDSSVITHEPAISSTGIQTKGLATETTLSATKKSKKVDDVPFTESPVVEMQQTVVNKPKELALSESGIDGSKFILELSNEELEKLGFRINHYAVYYRNHYNNQKVFYLATHQNGRFSVKGQGEFYNMKDYNPLQTDTIPENVSIKYMKITNKGWEIPMQNRNREDIEYVKTRFSFYPLFNTNQTGEIEKVNDKLKFNEVADTLLPVVIKYSQLDLEKKRDQFFWFKTNDDFYNNLPERYAWVKEEFEKLKLEKRLNGNQFNVDFKINDWHNELLIPNGEVLSGKDCIIQFTKKELEKIGVFKKDNNLWFYSHRTPYNGTAGGMLTEIVDGKPQSKVDTTFNVDYYAKYTTDCQGDFLVNQSSIKQMDAFFIDDDILLPVQAENKEGTIYWFTLSDKFWKLVPERYQYLKEHYNMMLYNKSIEPNRDFVKYFTNPFKKVGVDVSIIELSKKELENIGFKYVNGGAEINCGFGKNWIQFKFEDMYAKMDKKWRDKIKHIDPPFEQVDYISPNRRFVRQEWVGKFDSLFAASNHGYQFVYITDSLGRHMHKINILQEDIQINGEDFKYLIPIMVRNSKVTNPLSEDRVFWFTPTEAFFDRLPNRIKNGLEKEYKIVSSEGKSAELSACTYFESCKSTLKVENMKIYPNPAQHEITIDFQLINAQEGEILLANISGQQLRVLRSKSKFNEGVNTVRCELNDIKPGIYLISIVTPLGFKTERLIVTE